MDYFVSIENTPCQQWQAELLIESFKHHAIQNNLTVALALTEVPAKAEFCRNLYAHPRTHSMTNIGQSRGYTRLNSLYAMLNMLQTGLLKQPFALIESDDILYKPLDIKNIACVVFQINPFFTLELVKSNIPNLDKYLPVNKNWPPLGNIVYFDNVPITYFEQMIILTEVLAYEQAKAGKEIWKHTDRAAMAINVINLLGVGKVQAEHSMEMSLLDGYEHNFINYERGVVPHFSKSMYTYPTPLMLSLGDPFDALSNLTEHVGTHVTQYVAQLAKKCLAERII